MELSFKSIGQGPPLVILHGLYGMGDNWMNIAQALSPQFTVYLVDQRNHGNSAHTPLHNYNTMSADLKEFTDKLQLESFVLIGHSMGGKTAITFTLQHGLLVKKLICVDISPYSYLGLEAFQKNVSFHQKVLERYLTAPIDKATRRDEIEAYFAEKITDTSIRRFLLKNLARGKNHSFFWRHNVKTLANSLESIIDAAPPVKMGAQSYVPTLFFRGGKSDYISQEDVESIRDVFPRSQIITYEKCGHWLHSEEPERFIQDVLNFLL